MMKIYLKNLIHRFWAITFIVVVWLIFSSPYLFKGFVPYPSKYQVTFFHPWSHYEKWWGPVKNNAMPDIITQIYPWKRFTIDSLRSGHLPHWNPYNFAGNPHVGNFQAAVFSPFNLLYFLIPFIDAWSINVLLQPLFAGLFTYLFLKSLKKSHTAASIGSIVFMFSGFIVVWMGYGTLSIAIAYLPLVLYGTEKGFSEKKIRFFSLITAGIFLSFFSGHIQTSLYLIIFTILYFIFKFFSERDRKYILYPLGFFFFGIIISLVQLYPTILLFLQSARSKSLFTGGGIPFYYLTTIIAPDFYGNPVTRNDWLGNYAEWAGFVGIIPLTLAFIGIWLKFKDRYVAFFSMSAFIALILAIDTPVHDLLVFTRIPILATSIPSRIISLFSFSIAVLSACGWDELQNIISNRTLRKSAAPFLSVFLIMFIIWIVLLTNKFLPPDKEALSVKNFILPTILFMSTLATVWVSKLLPYKFQKLLTVFVVALLCFDSLRFAIKWMPFDDRKLVYPDVLVIDEIKKQIGYGRVFGNIGAEVTAYYGISSIEGYDPLYIERYGEFLRFASTGRFSQAERSIARLDRKSPLTDKALDLLGVNIIYNPIADTHTSWAYPVWENNKRHTLLYYDDKFQLFRNNEALSRARLYYDYEVITEKEKILSRIFQKEFDIRKKIILEENLSTEIPKTLNPRGSVLIKKYSSDSIDLDIFSSQEALLFLSDNYYPSWKAYINGKETRVYRANYTFRAILIPKGDSRVRFSYSYFSGGF